jgi:hypothetical protein
MIMERCNRIEFLVLEARDNFTEICCTVQYMVFKVKIWDQNTHQDSLLQEYDFIVFHSSEQNCYVSVYKKEK